MATDLTAGTTARKATDADMLAEFVPEAELHVMTADGRVTDSPSLAASSLLRLAVARVA